MPLKMRVGLGQFNEITDEILTFIKQMGADDFLMNTPKLPGTTQWKYEDLANLKDKADKADLRLMALENVPISFYDKIMLGLDGREDQLQNMIRTVRNMGRANIPILGYHWMPSGVWRTPNPLSKIRSAKLRGGAKSTRFNQADHDNDPPTHGRKYTHDEMWKNYCWYLERILPVAEESNVRLALHPDDPPTANMLGGVARICSSFDDFKRNMSAFDSPNHGLNFCMGCWSEMGGNKSVLDSIEYFQSRKKIIYIHFRDVIGTADNFHETFIDCGQVNTFEVVSLLYRLGFNGFMITDHVPEIIGDTEWGHRGRAHCVGFMQALIQTVEKLKP